MTADQELARGRAAADQREWLAAYESLRVADQATRLDAADLELLGIAAFLLGHVTDCLTALQRAYQLYADSRESRRAVRCAFWLLFHLSNRGDFAQANGWLARASRLLDDEQEECAERGFLLLPVAFQSIFSGDFATTRTLAARAADMGRRFRDADLVALALNLHGRALIYEGQSTQGLVSLDEAMLGVIAGELSAPAAGVVYCSVIEACHEIAELRRAHEWTDALSTWCARQKGMVTFTGQCLVHRAEIMRLRGAWAEAVEEAKRACERFALAADQYAAAAALYQQGEVFRERGDFSSAESAYQAASRAGLEPHPGLALLRLAQGNTAAARVAIGRVLDETPGKPQRVRLLPACVEIMLTVGDVQAARAAALELTELADLYQTQAVRAMAAQARGAVQLIEGDARSAVVELLNAWHIWRELEAPYAAAGVRVLIGRARQQLGDEEAARNDFDAARAAFSHLGAATDLARLDMLLRNEPAISNHGLTARELEVLRLLATGKTNTAIANELVVAAKTVDRHVSNIFNKLDVSSRAAATAFAYEHHLV